MSAAPSAAEHMGAIEHCRSSGIYQRIVNDINGLWGTTRSSPVSKNA
jgi:hypothetical protein